MMRAFLRIADVRKETGMTKLLGVQVGILTATLLLGCAGSNVVEQERNLETSTISEPEQVVVYDFAGTAADVPQGSAISQAIAERTTPQTPEEIALGKLVSEELVGELWGRGIPAILAIGAPAPSNGDVIVLGEFVSMEQGSQLQRVVIGFGAGASEVTTLAEAYVVTPDGWEPLGSATVNAAGGAMPGLLVPLGLGSAAGLAISGASKVATGGSESLEGAAKRTAKELADLIVAGYERRGWR
jgi:hypothetical protein